MNSKRLEPVFLATGALLLAYSSTFALINILKYNLGFSNLWNPFTMIVDNPNPGFITEGLGLLLVIAPAIALLLFILPQVQLTFNWAGDPLLTLTIHKGSRLSLMLVGLCLFVGGLFVLYFFAENWACLVGNQLRC